MKVIVKFTLFIIVALILTSCLQKEESSISLPVKIEFRLSEKTDSKVNKLINYGEITSRYIGEGGKESEQWRNYFDLRKFATEEELLVLVNHPNPLIRCFAFDVLYHEDHENCFDILKLNLNDTNTIYYQFGCMVETVQVNDYLIEKYSKPVPGVEFKNDSTLKIIETLVLNDPNHQSEFKNKLLKD